MTPTRLFPVLLWAARDLLRRPGEALLVAIAAAGLVCLGATPLLLTAGLEKTVRSHLESAPALVVRRVGAGGWMPIPVAAAVRAAQKVPGVIDARPRIWGTVPGPDGPLTVMAVSETSRKALLSAGVPRLPGRGEALAGGPDIGDTVTLPTAPPFFLRVIGRLPANTDLIAYDTLFIHPDDARRLLGLTPETASDLAVEVFHAGEQEAILPDLAVAFPWPVRIVTRDEAAGRYAANLARRGSIVPVTLLPAMAALVLLVTATVREHLAKRVEIGLYKAMGWTTGEVAGFMGLRAALVAIPAAALGAAGAYALVFLPGITWPARLFFGWRKVPPGLTLDPAGAGTSLVLVAAAVLLPYLLAVLWPTLAGAAAPPGRFLEKGKTDV